MVLDKKELAQQFGKRTKAIFKNTPNAFGKYFQTKELEFISELCINWEG